MASPTGHSAEFAEFQKKLLREMDKQVRNGTWDLPVTPSRQKIPSGNDWWEEINLYFPMEGILYQLV